MPTRITPDTLTAIGVLGAVITFSGYVLSDLNRAFLFLASAGLVVNWFGDSLDGTLARVRRIERPRYGFLVDHSTDLVSQVLVGLGLGISPVVHFDVACLALIVFLLFVAFSMIKATVGELQISYGGIGPTEVWCVLVVINTLLVWYRPSSVIEFWEPLTLVDLSMLAASGIAAVGLVSSAPAAFRRIADAEK